MSAPRRGGECQRRKEDGGLRRERRWRAHHDHCFLRQAIGTVPSSMTNSVPVIEEASGEATKATRSANALPLLIVEHRETAGRRR